MDSDASRLTIQSVGILGEQPCTYHATILQLISEQTLKVILQETAWPNLQFSLIPVEALAFAESK